MSNNNLQQKNVIREWLNAIVRILTNLEIIEM